MSSLGVYTPASGVIGIAPASEVSTAIRSARVASRLPFLDFLRAAASQLIVWHHLSFYGPLSEHAYPAAPMILHWLMRYARMAVQVFFVLGGFFTVRSLSRGKRLGARSVGSLVWQRYRRIGVPYLATLVIAVFANALARQWLTHDAISAPPTVGQLLAHAAFLHDILGYQSLTAGIWYLAIDFQLFLLTLVLFWAVQAWLRRVNRCTLQATMGVLVGALAPLAIASLFWFNRHPKFDAWAIYFVGSYFLGIVLHELLEGRLKLSWAAVYWSLVVVAAIVDPRSRLLVAAATTVIVLLAARTGILQRWPKNPVVNYFGRISYSLFLIHFPVLLVVNAWGAQRFTGSTQMAVAGLFVAYGLSLLAAMVLYHGVESRVR